jgi:hypothetical protein
MSYSLPKYYFQDLPAEVMDEINFPAAHVAHYERRTIGSDAIPGFPASLIKTRGTPFSATTRSFFAPIIALTTAT